jgi:histidyl-tRNA synthetase
MSTPRRPEGTQDILPEGVPAWRRLEAAVREVFERYGYLEVRPPLFESTALFHKSTGETTDIVEKQMFTVPSRAEGGESFTFRPEFTPGVIRLILENQLLKQRPCMKVWYSGPVFRYERPQMALPAAPPARRRGAGSMSLRRRDDRRIRSHPAHNRRTG